MSTRSSVYYNEESSIHIFYDLAEDHGCLYLEHGAGPYGLELQLPKDISDAIVEPLRRLKTDRAKARAAIEEEAGK